MESKAKIEKTRTILDHADDEIKKDVIKGKKSIHKAYTETQQKRRENSTSDAWPKCQNGTEGKCGIWGGNFPVTRTAHNKPAAHGLCRECRKEELRKQKQVQFRQEVEDEKKKFDATPVDAESDKFWNDLADRILDIDVKDSIIPCGKVSEEVRAKLEQVESLLRDYLYNVLENSTCPRPLST